MAVISVWDRFYAKVVVEAAVRVAALGTPCHWWIGARSRSGKHSSQRRRGGKNRYGKIYGFFHVGTRKDGSRRNVRVHRWLWEQLKGPIPEGWEVDHLCDNALCVNILHLEPKPGPQNAARANERRKAA